MRLRADVAVIGAGPAGCSTALFLARRSLRVVLVDKARFPRAKACGEGVMPSGVAVLERLGVRDAVERAGRPFRGVSFTDRRDRTASGVFPRGAHGVVVRRETLDAVLLARAKVQPGIEVLENRRATLPLSSGGRLEGFVVSGEEIRARHVVIADGSLSPAAESLGLPRRAPRRRRFGLRTHFAGVEGLADKVEVYLLDGGEVYVAPQKEPGTALVSLLLEERALARFASRTRDAFDELVRACAPLARRMRGAQRLTPIIGLGPLGGFRDRWSGPGWLLAGDAAGGVDPITGDGIALALQNGELAAEIVARRLSGEPIEPTGREYARRRRALMRGKRWRERFLLGVTRARPPLSTALFAGFARAPALFSLLLDG